MTKRKWILRGGLAAFFAGLTLLGILIFGVDRDGFKPQIVSAVRETTGRELTIDGDLELEFFPYLAVTLGRLELGNAEGFTGPFLTLDSAHLKVRLLPLLLSRLEVVALDVEGLSLFLARDASGRGNWDDLAKPPGGETSPQQGPVLARDSRVPVLASLIVDGLEISDARVVWNDAMMGHNFAIRGIDLDVSDFAFGEPFEVDTRAEAEFSGITAEMDFSTRAVLELTRLSLENLVMKARLRGQRLADSPEDIALSIHSFSTDGRLDKGRLHGLGLDARFSVSQEANATTTGKVDVADFSPREVFRRLGLTLGDVIDPALFGKVALHCAWTAKGERLDVTGLNLIVDNSTLDGRISLHGVANPALSFDLHADVLDLDRYITRSSSTVNVKTSGGRAEAGLPTKALRRLDLEGTLSVETMKAAGLMFSNSSLQLRAKDGMLRLSRIETGAYGGTLVASGSMDVRSKEPAFTWTHTIAGLQMGPFLRDLHGKETLTGAASGSARLQTNGFTIANLKQNLSGVFDFRVLDGALGGVNIAQHLRDGIRKLKGQAPGPAEPARTDFSVLSGSGSINRGLESTNDLLLLAPRFRIDGAGQADLVREDMDFRLIIVLEGSQGAFEEATLGLSRIPVRVSGPIREPTIIPDMEAVVRGLGVRGGQAVHDTIQGLGSGLNKGVEGLKRLFQ